MRGRQDAHVDRHFGVGADRADRLLLDRAQQLDLHRQRQLGDFVEEQRAAVGGLEQARLVGMGAGEAALLVAEELAFHQLGGDRAAVDRHERPGRARALLVDRARDQFLADAGFAGDVDRRLAARDLGRSSAAARRSPASRRTGACERIAGRCAARCGARFCRGRARAVTRPRSTARSTGLADEVEGAGLQRLDRGFDVAEGGDHRHRRVRVLLA